MGRLGHGQHLAQQRVRGGDAPILLRDHPGLLDAAIREGATLPADDAFAQVPRAVSTLDLVIHVPAGVDLAEPIVVRWLAGAAGTEWGAPRSDMQETLGLGR